MIFDPVTGTTRFSELFAALPQIKLDKPRAGGYNGAGRPLKSFHHSTTGAGTIILRFVTLLLAQGTYNPRRTTTALARGWTN